MKQIENQIIKTSDHVFGIGFNFELLINISKM